MISKYSSTLEVHRPEALEREQLALDHPQRRRAQAPDHFEVVVEERHLHGGGVDPVAEQNRPAVAPQPVDRRRAAPQRGVVDDVVVDQARGVDQLDDGGVGDLLLAVVAEHPRHQQQERRAHPLAAASRDVVAGAVDERHVGLEEPVEPRLGRLELVGDDGEELLLQRGEIRLLTVYERRVLRQPNGPIGRAAIR